MTDTITEDPTVGTVHKLDDHRPPAPAPPPLDLVKQPAAPAPSRTRHAIHIARIAATHDRTRTAGRLVVRNGLYVIGGARIVTRRAWHGRTAAVHQRMIAAAVAAGDVAAVADWQDKADRFRQARHARRMQLITGAPDMARAVVTGAAVTEGVLLAAGVAMALSDGGHLSDVIAPTMGAVDLISTVATIVAVVWGPALALAPWLVVAGLWAVGRHQGAAPAWAMPAGESDKRDVVPDEGAILDALRNLGIAPLNKAFKEGWQPRWVSPTVRLGNGWHSQLQLPLGVTVEMVNGRKDVLAHNLLRKPVEVWPTEPGSQPGVLDLWVADQGSLSGKVPAWPLLSDGEADYFKGVPVGVSQRGEPVWGKLMASNYMVGGIMGSGKSSLVVALLLGAMLDRLVDIEVYVMAYNVDYDPMKPRLRTLVKGDDDEQVEAALKALRALRDEVTLRGKLLDELGGDEVRLTRAIAERDPRMRPKVVVFDECHELFEHKKYGAEAAELAVKVMKKARKVGITLVWVTVSPTASSIPKDVTRNTSHRVAFAVGDHVANDGLLGTGKHRAGITATTLNPAENVGTALTVGFTRNPFELVRAYYVRKDSKTDEISPVVVRAVALRDGMTPTSVPAGEPADHLADILAVLGSDERVRTPEVLHRLKNANAVEYGAWDGGRLRRVLTDAGQDTGTYNGYPVVNRARVAAAIADRTEGDAE
jgi:S-DNA-T family DNA segregation ATPase FtsK/SpoIIIE